MMDQDSDIPPLPLELERRLEGLGRGLDGGVPGGVDLAVLKQAEGVLKRRRMAVAWGWSWRAGAVAAVLGVAVGLGVVFVSAGPRRGGVDMVDALRATKGGASVAEVRRIAGAAVRVWRDGGNGGGL